MDLQDPPLTALQATVLVVLRSKFSRIDPSAGLTYAGMLEDERLSEQSMPMLKKTIGELRKRSKPLIQSHTVSFGTYQKGRRPDVFSLHPDNALTDPDIAFYVVSIRHIPPQHNEMTPRTHFNYLVLTDLMDAFRDLPSHPDLGFESNPLVNDYEDAVERFLAPVRDTFADRIFDKLQAAYNLGYLAEPPSKDKDLHLGARAVSEMNYLYMLQEESEVSHVRIREEEVDTEEPGLP